jgi:hypothetical protein
VVGAGGNVSGCQSFHRRLGFAVCDPRSPQVIIDGIEHDEIPMERFL